jgi:hypothetical protein
MAKRPSPLPSYRGEDKTIQAMELKARRQMVLAVWPVPRSRSSPPTFTRLVIILFLQMLEEEAGHQLMWEMELRPSSLSTIARLMNILEAKHRWKCAAPTGPCTSSRGKARSATPTRWGGWRQKEHELSSGKFAEEDGAGANPSAERRRIPSK